MSANELAVSSPADWKQTKAGKVVALPSGRNVRLRAPGMDVFLRIGIIPDSITPIIVKALGQSKEIDLNEMVKDGDQLRKLFEMYDAITVYCMAEPTINPVPIGKEKRSDDQLYVDEVDFEDKVFIFQYAVGGTADVEKFRDEQKERMASISTGANVQLSPEPTDGVQ